MFNLSGWIKLPRWLITDEVFRDSRLWHVYCYLLFQANYKSPYSSKWHSFRYR